MFSKIEMCRKKGHVCEDDEISSWGSWRIGYGLLEFVIKVFHYVFFFFFQKKKDERRRTWNKGEGKKKDGDQEHGQPGFSLVTRE